VSLPRTLIGVYSGCGKTVGHETNHAGLAHEGNGDCAGVVGKSIPLLPFQRTCGNLRTVAPLFRCRM